MLSAALAVATAVSVAKPAIPAGATAAAARTAPIEFSAANSWAPFTASVEVALIVPAETLTILRVAPAAPTETVLATLATEPAPSATLFAAEGHGVFSQRAQALPALAFAFAPSAVA